jgi:G:T-mismatch repair DNA endonuclease (very short patch repair protein)
LWVAKMARNRRNDLRADQAAASYGYTVLRFWECALRTDALAAADILEAAVRGTDALRR